VATSKVLIVDDEESVAVTMAAILEMDGYAVTTALRGEDAIARLRSDTFDLVLTDLRLENFDGMDVLAEARRRSPDTIGIVLTGYASVESAVKALREGAYDYLLKPCDVEELRLTVARGMERRRVGLLLTERLRELEEANQTIHELNTTLQQRIDRATGDLQERVRELDAARREAQDHLEKLRELDKLKSQFLSIASHELKTPITAMSGFVQIAVRRIRRRLDAGRPREEEWRKEENTLLDQLEVVQRQTTKLARLVDELLDVSRIESGRLELRLTDVDVPELAAEVMRRHEVMSTKHELRLRHDPAGRFVVRADRDHIEQVLNNLIGNAMKYSPDGGPIEVTVASSADHEVLLSVSDHGMGIRESELPRIFGLFYRSPDRDARDVGGMGLGLYITKEIVDRHSGRIWAESKVGSGTTFHVALPTSVGAPVQVGS